MTARRNRRITFQAKGTRQKFVVTGLDATEGIGLVDEFGSEDDVLHGRLFCARRGAASCAYQLSAPCMRLRAMAFSSQPGSISGTDASSRSV
jgi:hypothetical protein